MQTFSKCVPSYYNSFKLWERNWLQGFSNSIHMEVSYTVIVPNVGVWVSLWNLYEYIKYFAG